MVALELTRRRLTRRIYVDRRGLIVDEIIERMEKQEAGVHKKLVMMNPTKVCHQTHRAVKQIIYHLNPYKEKGE